MIPIEYQINDTRDFKQLSKMTFSGFKQQDVVKALEKSLMNCKVEESVNWAVELLISGLTEKLWEKIFAISLKNININNPRLPHFLYKRYSRYVKLKVKYSGSIKSSNVAGYLSLRNSQVIRNMICEISVIICNSVKVKALSLPKIKEGDFDSAFIKSKLCADRANVVNNKLKYGDPEELKIPLNEFNFCLKTRKWELTKYWLAWILEWERRNTKKDKYYICGYRKIEGIEDKLATDVIWIIWEIIIKEVAYLNDSNVADQIYALFKLYKFDYKPAKKMKRVYFILYAIKYFTEVYNFKHDIISNHYQLVQACSNINLMFFEKKKSEINDNKNLLHIKAYNQEIKRNNIVQQKKLDKEEVKRLKKIANLKIENKIQAVEKIDSLILSKSI